METTTKITTFFTALLVKHLKFSKSRKIKINKQNSDFRTLTLKKKYINNNSFLLKKLF